MSPQRAGYMREYRAANPDYVAEMQRRQSARTKALRELGRRHPEELAELVKKHLARSRRASEADTG